MMVVLALAVFVTLASCAAGCSGNSNSTEVKLWMETTPLAAAIKETPHCEPTTHEHEALTQTLKTKLTRPQEEAGTFTSDEDNEEGEEGEEGEEEASFSSSSSEEASRGALDPCFHYTILDDAWRATNSTEGLRCDRNINWKGWYRLFYNGRSLQMPELCVPVNNCGTHAPLWLAGPHPRRRDGVVTRNVCGHWDNKCCAFLSKPIQVKKCRGNYFVYKLTKPSTCYLAYCADVNTLVCGQCSKKQMCVSQDKINWRCVWRKPVTRKVHFFAAFPAQLSGKVNRIKYSKVLVNMGGAFSRRSGVFRAPVPGVYQFFFSTQASHAGQKTDLWLVVNDYWVAVSHTHLPAGATAGGSSTYMTFLSRGAAVYVTHNCGQSWANAYSVTIAFGGSLLAQF